MALKNSFTAASQNIFNRKFGGTLIGTADPYVTGYHFIWFDRIPPGLPAYASGGPDAGGTGSAGSFSESEIKSLLAGACLSVTPPGGTLNKIDFTGLGGIKWAVPGSIDYGNSVSVKFLEFSKTPILDIMHGWVKLIRDYRTGAANLIDGDLSDGYSKEKYAALMYYWTTAPDGVSVEYYACYDGMFPNKDPQDLFSSDVENIGRLDIEIEFNVDYAWHEPWVLAKCKNLATTQFSGIAKTIKEQGKQEGTGSV